MLERFNSEAVDRFLAAFSVVYLAVALIVNCWSVSALMAWGQRPTRIHGTVTQHENPERRLEGAVVKAKLLKSKTKQVVRDKTDDQGMYELVLPEHFGKYVLSCLYEGRAGYVVTKPAAGEQKVKILNREAQLQQLYDRSRSLRIRSHEDNRLDFRVPLE